MADNVSQPVDAYADAIAIIGMSCRFPDAPDPDQYWRNLRDGVESVRAFTADDLLAAGVDPALMNHPNYVNSGVVLEDVEKFDAAFFGFSPRDAEILDPQQRFFLECAWHALEDAGYDPATYDGLIGVYGGADMSTYLFYLYANPEIVSSVGPFAISLANDKDHVTTRVAYKLNLKGPAVTIQTTCSTSLVAVCQASQSLLYYQCDMALAGGTAIALPQRVGYIYQEGGIASPDGRCRAFDAAARGTIGGSGTGIVVLKRYADALDDGDCIRAVIRGFGVNNDGSLKVGYTAPSVDGQADAIATAQAMAAVEPESISYIEAHGTGTPLGDPIELAALTQVFRAQTAEKGFCGIGSVKTNFGHLNSAAGVAGLIKVVLSLENEMLPPSLHFERPNPNIDFANSPFYVVDRLQEWKSNGAPRRAGVSSFGIGGTNAHLVVEEAPPSPPPGPTRPWQLVVLSAKSAAALDQSTTNLGRHLREHPNRPLADVAYTLQVGRQSFNYRRALLVAADQADAAAQALETNDARQCMTGVPGSGHRPIIFMFSGQGAQYVGMGRELYAYEPLFRNVIDDCCEFLQPHVGLDLRTILLAEPNPAATDQLRQTAITQPALFTLEYALAQLWMEWGIRPQAMVGHSIGEYVAACLADVISLEDALALVATRGRMMQELPAGAMLVVYQSERDVSPLLDRGLSLAAINGPTLCVVSGPEEDVSAAEAWLDQQRVHHQRLHTSHAFHSTMFEPMIEAFVEEVSRVPLSAPRIPYLSNLTGGWITADMATDPGYYGRHLRQTVQFARSVEAMTQDAKTILLEVGPGKTLSTLASQHPDLQSQQLVLSSLPHPRERQSEAMTMLQSLGQLWLAGVSVDWKGFYAHERRMRVSLPTYPFERQRYWARPSRGTAQPTPQAPDKAAIEDWFYRPVWQPASPAGSGATVKHRWLVLVDDGPLGSQLPVELQRQGHEVITVAQHDTYRRLSASEFRVAPDRPDHFAALFKELSASGALPDRILHLWSVVGDRDPGSSQALQSAGFFSLLFLAQVIAEHMPSQSVQLRVVTDHAFLVNGQEGVYPEQAMMTGACRVIGQELLNVTGQVIDITDLQVETTLDGVAPILVKELGLEPSEPVVALRPDGRWARSYQHVRLDPAEGTRQLRSNGVYLITGGLGGIGLALAEYLARTVQARLVLIGRKALPPRAEWQHRSNGTNPVVEKLLELEQLGAELMVESVDVTSRTQMQELADRIGHRFGKLDGIIHAAGVAGGGIIQLKTAEQAQRVMAPKLEGTQVLAEVFGEHELDFVILCSSLSAQLGGFGQIDYCAANCYLDAFAAQNVFQQHGTHTISVNWDTWAEVGMAVTTQVPDELKRWQAEGLRRGIKTADGMQAFERILGAEGTQVATSTVDLSTRIAQAIRLQPTRAVTTPVMGNSASHPRPSMSTEYVAPRTRTETIIAGIWQELLGIQQIGINDNFLELGGHSLLAIQLISRIRDALHYELSVQALFDTPTVAAIALLVDGGQPIQAGADEPPTLTRLPRDQFRGRISPEGTVELPDALKKQPKSRTGKQL